MKAAIHATLEAILVTVLRAAWGSLVIFALWNLLAPELLPAQGSTEYLTAYGLAMGIEYTLHLLGRAGGK